MKVLVTGHCGFIMSHLFDTLKKDHSVYGIDKRNNSEFIANINNIENLSTLFEREDYDCVIHGAAETFVDHSLEDSALFVKTNVLGTQNIIDQCLKYNVKMIYISTDEVYGQLGKDGLSWTEDSLVAPRNPYAASKAAGELMVMAAGESLGLNYNITRSSNNYGSRQAMRSFIPKIIKAIKSGDTIPIFGNGEQIRDWTYVQDNCNAICSVMKYGKNKEIYNISSNCEMTNLELVNKICDIMGEGKKLIKFVEDRKGHDFRYSVNSNRIRSLGWKSETSFEEGITETMKWY